MSMARTRGGGRSGVGESSNTRRGKKRAAEASNTQEQDDNASFPHFTDPLARGFSLSIMGRSHVKERSVRTSHRPTSDTLESHGLGIFFKKLEPIRMPWVIEFYTAGAVQAAADTSSCEVVVVRGRPVDNSVAAIQRLYKLPTIEKCEYRAMFGISEQVLIPQATVAATIAKPGTVWRGLGPLKRAQLVPLAQFYWDFIRQSIMPVSNKSNVTKEKAYLIYAIMTEKRIDFARIIRDALFKGVLHFAFEYSPKLVEKYPTKITGKRAPGVFFFPSLISALCKRAGVDASTTEKTTAPGAFLDYPQKQRAAAAPRAARGGGRGQGVARGNDEALYRATGTMVRDMLTASSRHHIEVARTLEKRFEDFCAGRPPTTDYPPPPEYVIPPYEVGGPDIEESDPDGEDDEDEEMD